MWLFSCPNIIWWRHCSFYLSGPGTSAKTQCAADAWVQLGQSSLFHWSTCPYAKTTLPVLKEISNCESYNLKCQWILRPIVSSISEVKVSWWALNYHLDTTNSHLRRGRLNGGMAQTRLACGHTCGALSGLLMVDVWRTSPLWVVSLLRR